MNPLKKLKLKSQLRNCDYMLAGTVIKQQYYDASKTTVINRLIDEFLADPSFDNALKLIEYNDMMVFYFTESCAGGLYVRKTASGEPAKPADLTDHKDEADLPVYKKEKKATVADKSAQEAPVAESAAIAEEPVVVDTPTAKHRRILAESEAWMEEMISTRKPKRASPFFEQLENTAKRRRVTVEESDQAIEESEQQPRLQPKDIEMAEQTSRKDRASRAEQLLATADSNSEDHVAEFEETIVFDAIRETGPLPQVKHETAAAWGEEPAMDYATDSAAEPATEFMAESTLPVDPDAPTATAPMLKLRDYPNVVATLKIDIHTMMKQLEDYRRELSYQPFNEQQLIAWIKSLEDAIEEFSEVVDMLEDR